MQVKRWLRVALVMPVMALWAMPMQADKQRPWMNTKATPEERARLLLAEMTLEEKVGQMEQMSIWDEKTVVEKYQVHKGSNFGSWLGSCNPETYNRLQSYSEASRLQIPYLIGEDAAHGDAMKDHCVVYPTSITMAATFNPALVETCAQYAAAEIRASGNHWTFAPCLDVVHDARWGRTGETYGEDPYLTATLARALIRGLQGQYDPQRNVAACAKHLLGGGASIGGVNHGHVELSPRTICTDFLPPFVAAIETGVASIMPGHNDVNGIPMHASKRLLTDCIKNFYGFKGFYISDMGDVENLLHNHIHRTADTQKEAVRQAVEAGLDMHMYSGDTTRFIRPLIELCREGRIDVKRIDDAVLRILTVKFRLGLFENRYVKEKGYEKALRTPEALEQALQAAREGVVLLKNDKDILPIDGKRYRRILVTGPNCHNQNMLGDWAVAKDSSEVVTLLDGMRREFPDAEIVYVPVGRIKGKYSATTVSTTDPETQAQRIKEGGDINDYDIERVREAARTADLIVVAGGGQGLRRDWGVRTYGESADRPSIDLYGRQVELIQAAAASGKPVVTVLFNGKPLNNPWVTEHTAALIEAWEPGSMGGQAVAEIISGRVNPSGRLPITIPQHAGQIPMFYYQTQSRYTTGYGLGSSRADDRPAFAFGHGLSYTTYACTDAAPADTLITAERPFEVKVRVSNTGRRDGAQTVMAFVRDDVSSVVTANRRLAAFTKVFLKAGESRDVTLTLAPDAFKLWNAEMKHVAESGTFTLYVSAAADKDYFKRRLVLR